MNIKTSFPPKVSETFSGFLNDGNTTIVTILLIVLIDFRKAHTMLHVLDYFS